MKRAVKVAIAFCFLLIGSILTQAGQIEPDARELSPFLTGFGFVLIMVAGLYGFLKIMRPFVS